MSLLDGFGSIVSIEVAWGDMDAWQHVNNARYFKYFETARLQFLTEIGWDLSADAELLPVVSHMAARYVKPVTYPASLRVGTRPTELREARFTLEHHIVVTDHQVESLATVGTSTVVPFHARQKRAARVPPAIRESLRVKLG